MLAVAQDAGWHGNHGKNVFKMPQVQFGEALHQHVNDVADCTGHYPMCKREGICAARVQPGPGLEKTNLNVGLRLLFGAEPFKGLAFAVVAATVLQIRRCS